jgi:hypothetical protein
MPFKVILDMLYSILFGSLSQVYGGNLIP